MKKSDILKLAGLNMLAGIAGMLLVYVIASRFVGPHRAETYLFLPWLANGLFFTRVAYERGWVAGGGTCTGSQRR
ncbi:MAG: hypothetical protein HQ523_16430 [Lentisphaerae bacterium]|nr:hypothetical protein [Lentisphaerota bacterium]